jgi:type IV secretory pathway VirB10-like protein
MKGLSIAIIPMLALGLAACHRQAAPERTVDAASPAATAAKATPAPAEASAGASAAWAERAPAAPARSDTARPATASRPLPVEEPAPVAPAQAAPGPPAPEPTPEPTPTPRPRIVAAGTALPIVLKSGLSTKTAKPEDLVVAELAENVVVDGDVLLPAGSEVSGHVVSAVRSGHVKGKAHLVVSFDKVRADGKTFHIDATGFDVTAGSSAGKDAKIAGGAAAGGVVIGAIAGGGDGAVKGGLIGGALGGAAVLATRGKEVELPAGSRYKIELRKSLHLN